MSTPHSKDSTMPTAVASAIAGIRSGFRPGTVMVTDRTSEWGCWVAKTNGETFLIGTDGTVTRVAS